MVNNQFFMRNVRKCPINEMPDFVRHRKVRFYMKSRENLPEVIFGLAFFRNSLWWNQFDWKPDSLIRRTCELYCFFFTLPFSRRSNQSELYKVPRTAESVQIFKGESRDPRTADLVQILKGEWRDPRTADLVQIFKGGGRDQQTPGLVRIF